MFSVRPAGIVPVNKFADNKSETPKMLAKSFKILEKFQSFFFMVFEVFFRFWDLNLT